MLTEYIFFYVALYFYFLNIMSFFIFSKIKSVVLRYSLFQKKKKKKEYQNINENESHYFLCLLRVLNNKTTQQGSKTIK